MDNAGCELNLELQGLERITYERSDEKACVQVNHPPRASLRADEARRSVRVRRAQARAFAACFAVSFLCPCRDYAQ